MPENYFLNSVKSSFWILFLLNFLLVKAQTQFIYNGLRYEIVSPVSVKVVSNGSSYTGNIEIPSTVIYNASAYSVITIGVGAFDTCYSLTSITIPASVSYIESGAFYDCGGLIRVKLLHSNPNEITVSSGAFAGDFVASLCDLYVPFGSQSLFALVNPWKTFKTINGYLGTSEINLSKSIKVYFNATDHSIYFKNLTNKSRLELYDAQGKLVLNQLISPSDEISVQNLPKGIYFGGVSEYKFKILIK